MHSSIAHEKTKKVGNAKKDPYAIAPKIYNLPNRLCLNKNGIPEKTVQSKKLTQGYKILL